jgi:hypothetical protein
LVTTSSRLRANLTREEWADLGGHEFKEHTPTRLRNGLINLEMGRLWNMYCLLRKLKQTHPKAFRQLADIRRDPRDIARRYVTLPQELHPIFCAQWPGPGDWAACDLTESVLRAVLDYDEEADDYVFVSPWPAK